MDTACTDDKKNPVFIYVDQKSIIRDMGRGQGWVTFLYTDTEAIVLMEAKCATRELRSLSITVYEKSGAVETMSIPTDWDHNPPDTTGDLIRRLPCGVSS